MVAQAITAAEHVSKLSAATVWLKAAECHFKTVKSGYMFTVEIAAG